VSSLELKAITEPEDKTEYKRKLIVEEICITEKEYLEDLRVLIKV
jgi:hypothetical protein